jgi:hypothetical protein
VPPHYPGDGCEEFRPPGHLEEGSEAAESIRQVAPRRYEQMLASGQIERREQPDRGHLHPGRQAEWLEEDRPALLAHLRDDHGLNPTPADYPAERHRALHADDPAVDPAWVAAFNDTRPEPVVGGGGPDDGHLWTLAVGSRMSSRVVGEEHHTDADWTTEPWTLEVRAWSLPAALRAAAASPLSAWTRGQQFVVNLHGDVSGPFPSRTAANAWAARRAAEKAGPGRIVSWEVWPLGPAA